MSVSDTTQPVAEVLAARIMTEIVEQLFDAFGRLSIVATQRVGLEVGQQSGDPNSWMRGVRGRQLCSQPGPIVRGGALIPFRLHHSRHTVVPMRDLPHSR